MNLNDKFKSQLTEIAVRLRHSRITMGETEQTITCNSNFGSTYFLREHPFELKRKTYSSNIINFSEKTTYFPKNNQ